MSEEADGRLSYTQPARPNERRQASCRATNGWKGPIGSGWLIWLCRRSPGARRCKRLAHQEGWDNNGRRRRESRVSDFGSPDEGGAAVSLNEIRLGTVEGRMKSLLSLLAVSCFLVAHSPAQTCREVVRDASGRIVQTIERQKQAGGTERAVTRDASGRITGTATTRPNAGSNMRTEYRDASGRLTGTASTRPTTGTSSQTTYRDASGRMTGSADTRPSSGNGGRTQYRDASGRITGTTTTSRNPAGTVTSTRRDNSGRMTGTSSGTGKCPKTVPMPLPPPSAKK